MGVGALVSGQYFPALGIMPALGRLFGPEDDRTPDAHSLVILSYDYWNTRFGADPGFQRHARRHRVTHDVIGVTPSGFAGRRSETASLFIPLAMARRHSRSSQANMHWLYVF